MGHSTSSNVRRARVLVIDDDPRIRELLRDFLGTIGCEVHEAGDGHEAVACLERDGYDLVVTDLAMPGPTGWDVTEAVRRRDGALPVLMLTGSATNPDVDRARALGVRILQKPIGFLEFRAAAAQALDARAGG